VGETPEVLVTPCHVVGEGWGVTVREERGVGVDREVEEEEGHVELVKEEDSEKLLEREAGAEGVPVERSEEGEEVRVGMGGFEVVAVALAREGVAWEDQEGEAEAEGEAVGERVLSRRPGEAVDCGEGEERETEGRTVVDCVGREAFAVELTVDV